MGSAEISDFGRNFCHFRSLRSILLKNVENSWKIHFFKIDENPLFLHIFVKMNFKRCLLLESFDFDIRNMDNFRHKKIIMIFDHPPPKFDEKNFHVKNNIVVFLVCLVSAHAICWFQDIKDPLIMTYTQLGTNRTFLEKVRHISSHFFPKNRVKKWGGDERFEKWPFYGFCLSML